MVTWLSAIFINVSWYRHIFHTFDTCIGILGVLNFCTFWTKEFLVIRKWSDARHATFVIDSRTHITTYHFTFFMTYPAIEIVTTILKEILEHRVRRNWWRPLFETHKLIANLHFTLENHFTRFSKASWNIAILR